MKTPHACLAVGGVFLFASSAAAQLWTTPAPVSEVNSQLNEGSPFLTYDGLSLYFSRQDPSLDYSQCLFLATRPMAAGSFTSVQEIGSLNESGYTENYPWVSPDNLRLYYYHASSSVREIVMSQRESTASPWTTGTRVAGLNDLGVVVNPSLTPDELTIVFARFESSNDYDIWTGTRTDVHDSFGNFTDLLSVNSGSNDLHPRLSTDGLTLYFASNRGGSYELFETTRSSGSPFGTPHAVEILGLPVYGQYPFVDADGDDLYFARVSGANGFDIYVSQAAVPAPGAVVLGMIGLSYAGWRLRRNRD